MTLSRLAWECIAAGTTISLGSLFHFTYVWSGKSPGTAWFSAVDESVWEHMHLVVFPWLVGTSLLLFARGEVDDEVFLSRAVGLVTTLFLIPAIFYLYTVGRTRKDYLVVDILIFILAIVAGGVVSWLLSLKLSAGTTWFMILGLLIQFLLLLVFTMFALDKPTQTEPFAT